MQVHEKVFMQSQRDDWCTPHVVANLLREHFFGGKFDLDPCSNAGSILPARAEYRLDRGQNGLHLPWVGDVFVNPPFSLLREFAAKAAAEHKAGRTNEIILLMASRTDTRAWHESVATASAVCFWRGRMTFLGGKWVCPFPIAFVYWGKRADWFERTFFRHGMVLRVPTDPLG